MNVHELGITRNIVAIVAERAGERRVLRVRLEIGELSAIVPGAIRFCFDVVTGGTVLEGAVLEIIEIAAKARCRNCGRVVAIAQLRGACACGSYDLEQLCGEELNIKEMELEAA